MTARSVNALRLHTGAERAEQCSPAVGYGDEWPGSAPLLDPIFSSYLGRLIPWYYQGLDPLNRVPRRAPSAKVLAALGGRRRARGKD